METQARAHTHTHTRYIHTETKPFQLNCISGKVSKNLAKMFKFGCPEAHGDLWKLFTVSALCNLPLILTHKGTLK